MKYKYTYKLRGKSLGCQPKGFVDWYQDPEREYETIVYDRELTEKEISNYELIDLNPPTKMPKNMFDVTMQDLLDVDEWEVALITYEQSNWDKEYTELQRTYEVHRTDNFFQKGKISNSMYGYCLDGTDNGVRLDLYNWDIERIRIVTE